MQDTGIEWHYLTFEKTKPKDFNDSLMAHCASIMHVAMHCRETDECLNATFFGTLGEARKTLEEWQEDCNWRGPYSALGSLTPLELLQRKAMDKVAA